MRMRMVGAIVLCVIGAVFGGCSRYVTPGAAASFRAMGITPEEVASGTDFAMREKMDRKPLAGFPCVIALARVQGPGYSSFSERAYGSGKYSVVTGRTVETDEHIKTLSGLAQVRGVATLNRLVLPERLETEKDLREAAASVRADMLLIYTFDTTFDVGTTIPAMGTITLGLFPNEKAKVGTTASCVLLDTRNGYVYGLSEASATRSQLANAWTSRAAVEDCRKRTEQEAFDKLVGQFPGMWAGVVAQYGAGSAVK